MAYPLKDRMGEILALTRAGELNDATALIQRSLGSANLRSERSKCGPVRLSTFVLLALWLSLAQRASLLATDPERGMWPRSMV